MPAPISIVIPTLNAGADLPETANALLPGIGDGLVREVVISDGGSSDDTLEIASELGAIIVQGARGRGAQIARGVAAAEGDWILILHADTHLSADWPTAVRQHMAAHPGAAGWFRLAFRSRGIAPSVVAAGANFRSRYLSLPYGDQGLLLPAALLSDIGGVPEVPLMEDVLLARRLKGRLHPMAAVAHTSAERYERDGWLRRVLRNLTTLGRFMMGSDPESLVKSYARSKGS